MYSTKYAFRNTASVCCCCCCYCCSIKIQDILAHGNLDARKSLEQHKLQIQNHPRKCAGKTKNWIANE